MTYDPTKFKCPKCGAELSDCWDGEPISAFVGEWSEDRFRCAGKLVIQDNKLSPFSRTKSCGYFGLEDFGVEYREDE
ncbi:hypothetical protein ACT2CV_01335 [Pasteurellaceae bacterium 22721_9_1]